MRAQKTQKPTTKKKYTRRKSKAVTAAAADAAAVMDEAKPSMVVLAPESPRHRSMYNGLVLLAAIVTLTFLAGSVALPSLFGSANVVEKRLDAAAIDREIARALGETSYPNELMLPVAPPVPAVKVEMKPEPEKAVASQPKPLTKAQRRLERRNVRNDAAGLDAQASAAPGNELIAEARKYLGTNPIGWRSEWCGAFLDMVLKRTGHRGGGNLARGYVKYGTRIAGPEVGAIVVLRRVGGGHVGIVTGVDANGNPIVISGNHNRRVAVSSYPASRVIAYVRPNG